MSGYGMRLNGPDGTNWLDTTTITGQLAGIITVTGSIGVTDLAVAVPAGCTLWTTCLPIGLGAPDYSQYLADAHVKSAGVIEYSVRTTSTTVVTYIYYGFK